MALRRRGRPGLLMGLLAGLLTGLLLIAVAPALAAATTVASTLTELQQAVSGDSGSGGGGDGGDGEHRTVFINGSIEVTSTIVIDGNVNITVRGLHAEGAPAPVLRGAEDINEPIMKIAENATVTLEGFQFRDGDTSGTNEDSGACVRAVHHSTVHVKGMSFLSCVASYGGGFYANDWTTTTIAGSNFTSCSATANDWGVGGGVLLEGEVDGNGELTEKGETTFTITDSNFDACSAGDYGSAMYLNNVVGSLYDVRASNNEHTAGAVMVWLSEASIENLALHDNSASYTGGGMYLYESDVGAMIGLELSGNEPNDIVAATSSYSCISSCTTGYYNNCTYEATGVDGCYANCKGCLECDAGKSTNNLNGSTHPSDCESCVAGTAAATAAPSCERCFAGKYATDNQSYPTTLGAHYCADCPGGTFTDHTHAVVCTTCGGGKYAPGGSAECQSCAAGKYSTSYSASCAGTIASDKSSSECTACAAGKAPNANQTACLECPAGKSADTGSAACDDCVEGWYANGSSAFCSKCSNRFVAYTSGAASAACDECVAGYYKHYRNNEVKCSVCPEGTACPHNKFSSLDNLDVLDGQYRFSARSQYVYPCPLPSNCPQVSSSNETGSCAEGSFGALCELCEDGWTANAYAGECTECSRFDFSQDPRIVGLFVVGGLLPVVVGGLVYLDKIKNIRESLKRGILREIKANAQLWKPRVSCILKTMQIIVLLSDQMVTDATAESGSSYPNPYAQFVMEFEFASLDVRFLPWPCVTGARLTHWNVLLANTLSPICAVALGLVVWAALRYRDTNQERARETENKAKAKVEAETGAGGETEAQNEAKDGAKNERNRINVPLPNRCGQLLISFIILVLPSVSKSICETFSCDSYNDIQEDGSKIERLYLRTDYDISCGEVVDDDRSTPENYQAMRIFAGCMIAIYPVGVPLMIFCLLFPLRKRLNPEADTEAAQLETTTNDKVLAHSIVTSVFRKYRPKWWAYDLVDIARRLLLTTFVMLFSLAGTALVFASGVAVVTTIVHRECNPYLDPWLGGLSVGAHWQIVLVCMAMMMKGDVQDGQIGIILLITNVLLLLAIFIDVRGSVDRMANFRRYGRRGGRLTAENGNCEMRQVTGSSRKETSPDVMITNPLASSQTITFGKNSVTYESGGKAAETGPEVVVEVHESSGTFSTAGTVQATVDKFWEAEPTTGPSKEPTNGGS